MSFAVSLLVPSEGPPLSGGGLRRNARARIEISGENAVDHVAVHIGETHVAATESIGEFFVIQSQKPEDRGVEIVHFRDVLG